MDISDYLDQRYEIILKENNNIKFDIYKIVDDGYLILCLYMGDNCNINRYPYCI